MEYGITREDFAFRREPAGEADICQVGSHAEIVLQIFGSLYQFANAHATVVQDRNTWLSDGIGGLGDGCWTTSLVDTATLTGSTSNGWAGRIVYQLGTMNAETSRP